MRNHFHMCLNHISIFCRHSSYHITYTIASFVNRFSLLLCRTETKQQLLCRMIAMTTKGFNSGWTLESTQSKRQTYPKELLYHYHLLKLHNFSVLVGVECHGNGGRTPNPRNLQAEVQHPPPPFQCVMQEQIYGATVPCSCLQVQSTGEMMDEFRSGKCQAKINVNTPCLGTRVGFRPDFRPSKEVQAAWVCPHCGRAGSWSLPFCAIPSGSCSRAALEEGCTLPRCFVTAHLPFTCLYCNSMWCG